MNHKSLKQITSPFDGGEAIAEQLIRKGITIGVPEAEYHALPRKFVSKHDIDAFAKCPAAYNAEKARAIAPASTPALIFGRAFHARVLEPETFGERFAVQTAGIDRRTTAGKEAYAAFVKEAAGKEILTAEQAELIETMSNSFESAVAGIWGNGIAEAVLIGNKIEVGDLTVYPRGKADYISEVDDGVFAIFDVKTTSDASAEAFRRDCANYRYDVQAAYYSALFKQAYTVLTGKAPKSVSFFFVCVEKAGICPSAIYELNEDFIALGEKTAKRDLEALIDAMTEGAFPSYNGGMIETIAPPAWLTAQRGF